MKNKNHKHYITIHQRLERAAHHRATLAVVLSFMVLGYIKYETQLLYMLHEAYNQGFGLISTYAHQEPHHDEITRMPVQYGNSMRNTPISGE